MKQQNTPTPDQKQIVQQIIDSIKELNEDHTVPRNIKIKFERVMKALEEDADISIRVDKAQQELDEISDDSNLQAYTRTQIWNVVSLLEKL